MSEQLTKESSYFARPDGIHYHQRRSCPLLQGNQFKEMHYREIKYSTVKRRLLSPCSCTSKWYQREKDY